MKQTVRILTSLIVASVFVFSYHDSIVEVPSKISSSENDFKLETTTIPTALEDSLLIIEVSIEGPVDSTLNFQFRNSKAQQDENTLLRLYARTPLSRSDSSRGLYSTRLQSPTKGAAIYYYFEILDPVGRYKASLKMPDGKPIKILGIGNVPVWLKYSTLTFLFIAIFSIAFAAMLAFECKDNYARTGESVKWLITSIVCLIPGIYFFDSSYRAHLLGETWQGVPFGANLSDNLVQILIVFVFLVIWGSKELMANSEQKTGVIGKSSYRKFVMAALVLSLFSFVLPSSIDVSASHTVVLTYSILVMLLLSYAVLFFKAKSR